MFSVKKGKGSEHEGSAGELNAEKFKDFEKKYFFSNQFDKEISFIFKIKKKFNEMKFKPFTHEQKLQRNDGAFKFNVQRLTEYEGKKRRDNNDNFNERHNRRGRRRRGYGRHLNLGESNINGHSD